MVQVINNDTKDEIKSVRKEVSDLKSSVEFSSRDVDNLKVRIDGMERNVMEANKKIASHDNGLEGLFGKQEYIENQSQRNNVKLIGIPESPEEETWDDSEKIFIDNVKSTLKIKDEILVERAHRVGPRKEWFTKPDGSRVKARPRPIIAKLSSWKQREKVLKAARDVRPEGILFVEDLSQMTLDKRNLLRPRLKEEREKGNIAFFKLDKLIIRKGRPPSRNPSTGNGDDEIQFKK